MHAMYQSQTEYIAHAPVAFHSAASQFLYSDRVLNSERLNLPVPTLTAQSLNGVPEVSKWLRFLVLLALDVL